jgi:MFS family permease
MPVDWLGAILAAAGLGALVFGLLESSRLGFGHPSVVIALVAAGLLLAIFLAVEARLSHPMLPLNLFRSRTFTGANLLTLFLYAALGGTLFFLPLNLIQVQGYSTTAAGASLLPFVFMMSFLSRWSGGLVTRYGARIPLVIGPLIAAFGFALFILPAIGGSYWTHFFPAIVVLGLGMAVSVAPLTTTVMNSVAPNRVGLASGVNNAVARSGSLLAIAVLGLIMLRVFSHALDKRSTTWNLPASASQSLHAQQTRLAAIVIPAELGPASKELVHRAIGEAFVSAFRVVSVIGACLAAASALTALALIRKTSTAPPTRAN